MSAFAIHVARFCFAMKVNNSRAKLKFAIGLVYLEELLYNFN